VKEIEELGPYKAKPKELNPYLWLLAGLIVSGASWFMNIKTGSLKFTLFLVIGVVMVIYGFILVLARSGLEKEKKLIEKLKKQEDAMAEQKARQLHAEHQRIMMSQQRDYGQKGQGNTSNMQGGQQRGQQYSQQQGQAQNYNQPGQYNQLNIPPSQVYNSYCPNCRAPLRHTDRFCYACGVRVR